MIEGGGLSSISSHHERGVMIWKEGIWIDALEIRDITGLQDRGESETSQTDFLKGRHQQMQSDSPFHCRSDRNFLKQLDP
jgi:hypothetical protein